MSGQQLLISFEVVTGDGRTAGAAEPMRGDAAPPPGRTTDVDDPRYRSAARASRRHGLDRRGPQSDEQA